MKCNYFIASLVLIPLAAFGQNETMERLFYTPHMLNKNSIEKTYNNESDGLIPVNLPSRTLSYPTQIIRMNNNIENQQVTCEQVNEEIETKLIAHITPDRFIYNTYISCTYDPDTLLAKSFVINSYFDPINEESIEYLQSYLSEYNGSELLGTQLTIEKAQSLIMSLSITAGMKKNPNNPPFIEYRQDRSNFYFDNNYDLSKKLFNDMYQNFFSNDPTKVLPFLDRWIFPFAGSVYKSILKDSNFVELQPERIFIMENKEKIFVSGLKFYFGHRCYQYENHRCLPANA